MVRQRGHLTEVKNLEKFWNSRRRGFLSSRKISKKRTRKVGQRSQDFVAGKEMHFQVNPNFFYNLLLYIFVFK